MFFEQINQNITVVRDLDGLITLVVDLRVENCARPLDWCKWARETTTGIDDRFWDPLHWEPDIRHRISEHLFSQSKQNANRSYLCTESLLQSITEKVDTCMLYREIVDIDYATF